MFKGPSMDCFQNQGALIFLFLRTSIGLLVYGETTKGCPFSTFLRKGEAGVCACPVKYGKLFHRVG